MTKYRRKPIEVEAIQFDPDKYAGPAELMRDLGTAKRALADFRDFARECGLFVPDYVNAVLQEKPPLHAATMVSKRAQAKRQQRLQEGQPTRRKNMITLTKKEQQRIRERAEKATPGPWGSHTVLPAQTIGPVRYPESPWRVISGPPQEIDEAMLSKRAFTRKEDAEFIACARVDIPCLLDALETAERDLHDSRNTEHVALGKLEVAEAKEPYECSLCENDLEPADFIVCSNCADKGASAVLLQRLELTFDVFSLYSSIFYEIFIIDNINHFMGLHRLIRITTKGIKMVFP